jgi:hypothetical protein
MNTLTRPLLAIALAVVAACSASAGASVPPVSPFIQVSPPTSTQPSASAAASAAAGGSVGNPDEAAQRVIALDPRFTGLKPKNPDLIGGCCFYEAATTPEGFQVTVELGWGDCPAGCINRHRWTYAVARDGTTTLLSETGQPVPSNFPAGGGSTY